jgi:dienelactone hydrolase
VIILHEIYGLNEHITRVARDYLYKGYDIYCPDLLEGKTFQYSQCEEAYDYFMNHVKFEVYHMVNQFIRSLRPKYRKIILLGYSIGATIAWRSTESGLLDCMVGYYGSRIRDYPDVTPKCPSLLLFAKKEKSFDALKLSEVLKSRAKIEILEGRHGFCDPFCSTYSQKASDKAKKLTLKFLFENRVAEPGVINLDDFY